MEGKLDFLTIKANRVMLQICWGVALLVDFIAIYNLINKARSLQQVLGIIFVLQLGMGIATYAYVKTKVVNYQVSLPF